MQRKLGKMGVKAMRASVYGVCNNIYLVPNCRVQF